MASKGTTIGAGIALDGEKEFKRALTEINQGLKVTSSELVLLSAKYADNGNSIAALTAKNTALENRMSSQAEKVNKLKEALTNAAQKYGESDKRTMEWQRSLNMAEAELITMGKELETNSKALETAKENMKKYGEETGEAEKGMDGLGSKISDIAKKLGINLPAGADTAIRSLDGTKASTVALLGVTTGLIAGFAKLTIETAKTADEILTLSSVSGLSTDTIQEMNYSAGLLDVSTETMTSAMSKMIRSMDDAKNGVKEASEGFKQLRVSWRGMGGELKDSEQMFYEVIDALGRVKNETERDAMAMQIFGRSARELNPLIEAGSKGLKEFAAEAHEMGYVMDASALESFGALDDAMERFNNQGTTLKNTLAMALLPVLTGMFELLNKIDPKILATVAIIGSMAVVAVTVMKGISAVTETVKAFSVAGMKTTAIVVGVVAALIALAAIIAVIMGKSSQMNQTMRNIGDSIGSMTANVNGAQSQTSYRYVNGSHAGGLDYVPYDGYVAELHKGERVQRADENPYNPNSKGSGNQIINMYVHADDLDQASKIVKLFEGLRQDFRMA